MKKALFAAVAFAGLSLGFAGAASAAPYADPGINQRERDLNVRIDRGARDGSLTRGEVISLRSQMRDFRRVEARYSFNGFNRAERADLQRRLDAVSAHVYNQRHDWDRRGRR